MKEKEGERERERERESCHSNVLAAGVGCRRFPRSRKMRPCKHSRGRRGAQQMPRDRENCVHSSIRAAGVGRSRLLDPENAFIQTFEREAERARESDSERWRESERERERERERDRERE